VLPGAALDDVAALRRIFAATHPEADAPVDPGSGPVWFEDQAPGACFETDLEAPVERRDEIEAHLAPIWERRLAAAFVDHRAVVSTFLMKWPGEVGHLPLHQDPSFVDERTDRAVTLWIAIDDASPELGNGPLHVIPGSHLAADEYRGTNTSSSFLAYIHEVWPLTVPVPVRSGDAVVLDGRLVHGSPPNTTDRLRLAVTTPVVRRDARLIHVVGVDDENVVLLEVEDDFYRRTSPRRLWADPPVLGPDARVRPRARQRFELGALQS
jgi:hypothetical protein